MSKLILPKATTTQSLGSLLKSARDIMRKDKGLNGDLDRLPMLTWIMFLKFLDDLEIPREEEAKLAGPMKSTPHPGPMAAPARHKNDALMESSLTRNAVPVRGGELNTSRSQVDALQNLCGETAAELDALLQAILDKAFKGES
jgi:hypothetical protein